MRGVDIKERLERAGRTQAALSRHMGLSVHAMNRLVRSEKELRPSQVAQVEAFFGPARATEPMLMRVPVYGYVADSGSDRVALGGPEHVLEEMEIPVGLIRGNVIALRVPGDSMEPRLHSGEVVLVSTGVTPARSRECVVELRDGSAVVKEYRGQRDGMVFLYQYNPEGEVRLDASQVKAIHAVPWRR